MNARLSSDAVEIESYYRVFLMSRDDGDRPAHPIVTDEFRQRWWRRRRRRKRRGRRRRKKNKGRKG